MLCVRKYGVFDLPSGLSLCVIPSFGKATLVGNSNPYGHSVSSGVACIACSQAFVVLFHEKGLPP